MANFLICTRCKEIEQITYQNAELGLCDDCIKNNQEGAN